jgi:PAS domain S-box-containing protein
MNTLECQRINPQPRFQTGGFAGDGESLESRVIDSLPSLMLVLDDKGCIIRTNKAWRDFAADNGLNRDFIGEDYLAVCDRSEREGSELAGEAAAGIRRVIAGETDFFTLEYPCHTQMKKRWFQMRVIRIIGSDPPCLVVSHLDITKMRLIEESLRENEEKFRRITENMQDVVSEFDDMGRMRYASPSYRKILGYDPSEMIGKCSFSRFHPDDVDSLLAAFRESIESGSPATVELRYRHALGHQIWLESRGSFLRDVTGKITGAVISSRDITKRKKAEEALRESEERFRSLVESTSDWIWEVDTGWHYTYVSPNVEEIIGYRPEEVIGRKPFELMPSEEGMRSAALFKVIQDAEKPYSGMERIQLHKNGRRVVLESCGIPIYDRRGALKGYRGIARDVTQRKILEAKSVHVRHLASIGQLAAGVAHEINNPLTGIINYAQILADEAIESGGDLELFGRIIKEGERIAKIVSNLLSFARESAAEKRSLHLGPLIEDSVALMASHLRKDGIQVSVSIPSEIPKIAGNRKDLQQVLLSILTNSRYALNKKYKLFDPKKNIRVTAEERTSWGVRMVRLILLDTGTGMSPEVLSRVFDPFFSTKPPSEATGLGLSASYGILKDHKGNLEVESVEGEYTKVILDLPVFAGGSFTEGHG